MAIKLELVDYTYAETCNGVIRIHKDLQYFSKELFDHALEHELGHQDQNVWEDFVWDMKDLMHFKIHFKALGFYLKHPELILRMISPIHYNKKARQVEVNITLFVLYFLYMCIFIYFLVYV